MLRIETHFLNDTSAILRQYQYAKLYVTNRQKPQESLILHITYLEFEQN